MEHRGKAISTLTAAIFIVAILVVGLAAGLTVLTLGHGGTNSLSTSSATTSRSLLTNSSTSSSSSSSSSSSPNSSLSSSTSSSISSSSTTSYSSIDSNIVYIPTYNSQDDFGSTDIYSAIDSNSGTLGWVAQTSQHDSLYTVSSNQLSQFKSNLHQTPTGLTFDSTNNIAYLTTVTPGGGPTQFYAISGNKFVGTPISANLQSSPQTLSYDQHYDYLYVSVAPRAMTPQTETGVEVFDPGSGSRVAYIPLGTAPNAFAYDSESGDMFAATQDFSGSGPTPSSSTIYDVRGLSIGSSFGVQNVVVETMTFDPGDGLLYIANQSGDVVVLNPSSHSVVGTIDSSYHFSSMTFDSKDGYIYAFFGNGSAGQMQVISGAKAISSEQVSHTVTSAQYNVQFDNILAFY